MPLIIIKDRKELPQDKISDFLIFNDSGKEIQYEYCFAIEFENQDKKVEAEVFNPDCIKFFSMVLNGNEICDARHYWEHAIRERDCWNFMNYCRNLRIYV